MSMRSSRREQWKEVPPDALRGLICDALDYLLWQEFNVVGRAPMQIGTLHM